MHRRCGDRILMPIRPEMRAFYPSDGRRSAGGSGSSALEAFVSDAVDLTA
jgi:hypothetical protein